MSVAGETDRQIGVSVGPTRAAALSSGARQHGWEITAVFSVLQHETAGEHCGMRAIVATSASRAATGLIMERCICDRLTMRT